MRPYATPEDGDLTLDVCVDCLVHVANGDLPEDHDEQQRITDGVLAWWHDGFELAAGDAENDQDFSWARCECCGSTLGGSRHEVVAYPR